MSSMMIETKPDQVGNFTESVRQLNRDTDAEAQKWFAEKRSVKLPSLFWKMITEFFKIYFMESAWKNGFFGFMRAVNGAFYQLMCYAKYWELTERERGRM